MTKCRKCGRPKHSAACCKTAKPDPDVEALKACCKMLDSMSPRMVRATLDFLNSKYGWPG